MATFRDRNHLIAEANSGAPFSHFAWFHPNFYSAPKTSLNHLHSAQVNPERGHPIAPIRYVPVETGPTKNIDLETKPSKARKQKPSKKSSNEEKDPNIVKVLKPRQSRKKSSGSKTAKATNMPAAKREKKDPNIVMAGINLDFSGMPSPVCSCTGVARVCYKWGVGGWQSSCCTINISEYPLPIKSSRPGSRMAGRKMSNGAYGKLIMRLAAEAYDLTHPVDLKDHWARHGTNKFVTIK